jgi:hypothetical protein
MILGHCSAQAQPSTGPMQSPNLVGAPYSNITGTTPITIPGGGYSGGNTPGYNSSTNTIYFGYTQSVAAYTYAFNQALRDSGMTILGYNYSWSYLNQGQSSGTLSAAVNFAGADGTSLHTKNWILGPTTEWTSVRGTETFANNGMAVASIANFSLSFSGKDSRFWAGYYGPQVKDPSLSLNYTFDQCSSNPLSSPTCPGYAAAYLTQQCAANPLYNTSCPGYAAAYQIQQCTINPISDPSCPGYATAYLNYQCSVNPLYSTTCAGYEQAYLNSQCIKDSLYSRLCEGYNTAYAIKYLTPISSDSTVANAVNGSLSDTAAVKANDPATTKVAVNTVTTSINTDGSVSIGVSATGDTIVDKAITSKASTTNTAPAAVQLAPPPPPPAQQMSQNEPKGGGKDNKQEDKKDDAPKGTGGTNSPQNTNNAQASSDKPAAPTARQALQERREAAAKAEAVEKGKNLAGEMGKASDLEAQKAVQNVVISAMGFTPGFDAYSRQMIVQQQFYPPYQVYGNQKTIDNRANLRMFGGTDRLHNEMVEKQYERK